MAYVLLILGLIAAGIYTENVAFYVFAGLAGFMWFLTVIFIGAITSSVKKGIDEGRFSIKDDPAITAARIRNRRRI